MDVGEKVDYNNIPVATAWVPPHHQDDSCISGAPMRAIFMFH